MKNILNLVCLIVLSLFDFDLILNYLSQKFHYLVIPEKLDKVLYLGTL